MRLPRIRPIPLLIVVTVAGLVTLAVWSGQARRAPSPMEYPIPSATILVGLVAVTFAWLITMDRQRFFTLEQRGLAGRAYGANCIWRPCHWLPGIAAFWTGQVAWSQQTAGATHVALQWWTVHQALNVLTAFGMPITRQVFRCGGTVQGGHQWPAALRGTTSIWNCEPACASHNRAQSATWSTWWAFKQWGPLSLIPYLVRNWVGTVCLAGLIIRENWDD